MKTSDDVGMTDGLFDIVDDSSAIDGTRDADGADAQNDSLKESDSLISDGQNESSPDSMNDVETSDLPTLDSSIDS